MGNQLNPMVVGRRLFQGSDRVEVDPTTGKSETVRVDTICAGKDN